MLENYNALIFSIKNALTNAFTIVQNVLFVGGIFTKNE